MLCVRNFPQLASPRLWGLLRAYAAYDADGRASREIVGGGQWGAGARVPNGRQLAQALQEIAHTICPKIAPEDWESVLVQCYRDGSAVTPCHADLNSGLGFILSLGAPRTLRFHRVPEGAVGCGDYDLDPIRIECLNGTAVIMDEEFHRHHHHQIVPDPGAGERMGLVFRTRPGR